MPRRTADLPLHQSTPSELKAVLEAERDGTPFLRYVDGTGRQHIVILEDGERRLTVGRAPQADVPLAWDTDVSRLHAELEQIGGFWTVIDDGLSRNGTFVNGERARGRRRLDDLDRLQFGSTTVIYRAPADRRGGTTSARVEGSGGAISDAQRRVLVALARPYATGRSFATPAANSEIAAKLFLSVPTVKGHLRALCETFGVQDLPQNRKRARLVELAFQSGEITERDFE